MTTYTYDANTNHYKTFDKPGAVTTYGYDTRNGLIIGSYIDSSNVQHGFIGPVPEPSTFVLGVLAMPALWWAYRRKKLPRRRPHPRSIARRM